MLIVSSFESLLETPVNAKTETFSYALKLFWGFDDRIKDWAKNLYELRNRIVHGVPIEKESLLASKHHHYPHFKIAREIYHNSILLLFERKMKIAISTEYKKRMYLQLKNLVVSNREKLVEILENKVRYNFTAFLNDKELYKEFMQKIESLTMTDYSAGEEVIGIISLALSIIKEWLDYLLLEIGQSKRKDDFIKLLSDKYIELIQEVKAINLKEISEKESYVLHEKLGELIRHFRKLEQISYRKDEYNFEITEFATRVFNSLQHCI